MMPFFAIRSSYFWLPLGACLLLGCTATDPHLDRMLLSNAATESNSVNVAECYAVGCPDVIDVAVDGRPDLSGRETIGVDGRIDVGTLGRLRVSGQSLLELGRQFAQAAAVPADKVHVHLAEYRSQQVFLFGQVAGQRRVVPYQGPESVRELLQRVGGITPGAAPGDVYVIRSRVPDGQRPEVYHVDLHAIVLEHDPRTDIRVQPFDQIYVGQNRRSVFEKCFPPCLQPIYELFSGLYSRKASASQ